MRTEPLDLLDVGVALSSHQTHLQMAPQRLHRAARETILHRQGLPRVVPDPNKIVAIKLCARYTRPGND